MTDETRAIQTALDTFQRDHPTPDPESPIPNPKSQPTLDDLVSARYLSQNYQEPFGGQYLLIQNPQSKIQNSVVISSNLLNLRNTIRQLQAILNRATAQRHPPTSLQDLIQNGYLSQLPPEPFGGQYLIQDGHVQTTTQFPPNSSVK